MNHHPQKMAKRPSLRDEVINLDRDILNLLLRRYNLLQHMKGSRGYIVPLEEKQLREAWQANASRLSQDPRLTSQLFNLLQDLRFLPKPRAEETNPKPTRPSFNLAPAQKPVDIKLKLPLSHFYAEAHLITQAFLGQELFLQPTLMHDGQLALLRILKELGAPLNTHDDYIELLKKTHPLEAKDLSLHVGSDLDNFYLLLAQYLVRPSRARFTAEGSLKFINLHNLAKFLPSLGARLAFNVPKNPTFPLRIEASGLLPNTIVATPDLPANFLLALALALPFTEKEVCLDLSAHPEKDYLLNSSLEILESWGAESFEVRPYCLQVNKSNLSLDPKPTLPCELKLTSFIILLTFILGGEANFSGLWPTSPLAQDIKATFINLGLKWQEDRPKKELKIKARGLNKANDLTIPPESEKLFFKESSPLMSALASALTLTKEKVILPSNLEKTSLEFFQACGLKIEDSSQLCKDSQADLNNLSWTAPSPEWSLAYASCAAARLESGFKLTNAGIITQIWPKFWALYNGLPTPLFKPKEESTLSEPKRRRILSDTKAEIPSREIES